MIINLQVLHNDRVARWQLAFFPTAPLNKENYITGQKINIFYTWALCALSSAQQFWFVLCIVIIFLYFILYCIWQGRQLFFCLKKETEIWKREFSELQYHRIWKMVQKSFLRLATLTCALKTVSILFIILFFLQLSHLIYLWLFLLVSQKPD